MTATHRVSALRRLGIWLALLLLAGVGVVIWKPWKNKNAPTVSTAEVKMGEFVEYIQLRGEVRARSSTFIIAPFNAGDLQILKLSPDGTHVTKGDAVVQFDPTSLQRTLDQIRSTLRQTEAEIDRMKAQQRLQEEQSLTDKVKADFDVERARLDAGKGDVVPAIENEKNLLALGKAQQKVHEVEERIACNKIGNEADLAGNMRRRDKANADLQQAEKNLGAMTITSPVDGLIMMLPNSRARTSIMGGGTTPVFKEGDRVWAGATIAELPDLLTIQVNAPVEEADRGRLEPNQQVTLRIDAVPDKEHKGSVSEISPLAKVDYSSYPYKKNFDLTIHLENPDSRLRPGMSATARVAAQRFPDSILIPVEAVFEKGGRLLVYVLKDGRFEERVVEAARRGEGQVLVARGLKAGERVALKDPTLEKDQK
jgi:RND family efflux transporter MFP subunit